MKKLILNLALLAVIVAAFSIQGCKKDEVVTNKSLLQGFKWKVTGETTDGKESFSTQPACEKDNTLTFGTDGNAIFDEGAIKCASSDPQSTTNTYTLSADENTVTVKEAGFSLDFKILEISKTTLKLESNFLSTVVQTFTRQ